MAFNWSNSYSSVWKFYSVNKDTWSDGVDLTPYVSSISLSKDGTDNVPLLETGSASLDLPYKQPFKEGYYRIIGIFTQGSISIRVPIATFLMEQTKNETKSSYSGTVSVNGRSVLAPAADRVCLAGTYAPKGANGAEWVKNRLDECLDADVEIIGMGFT